MDSSSRLVSFTSRTFADSAPAGIEAARVPLMRHVPTVPDDPLGARFDVQDDALAAVVADVLHSLGWP